jgi:saccharopine dehydrogenase-like NADP-dependent oxidoreductase
MANKNSVLIIGTGFYGIRTLQLLAKSDVFSKIVIGELDMQKAKAAAEQVGGAGKDITVQQVDATSEQSLLAAMKGVDLVVNITARFTHRHTYH